MYEDFKIKNELLLLVNECETELKNKFAEYDKIALLNSGKILKAFQENNLSNYDFSEVTGYGYSDGGREKLEKIYCDIFKSEDALVRPQIMSGTHALSLTLFGNLKYGDVFISITGEPYDTLQTVIGLTGDSSNSLIKNGIKYEQIDLINDEFDTLNIQKRLSKQDVKLVEIQRSCGYSLRKSITIDKIENICKKIREINKDVIIMVDNCYGEFVEEKEPVEVGADIIVGSHMKNIGGGIAKTGGYIVGKKDLILNVAERFSAPGIGKDIGANLNQNMLFYKGLYLSPSVVCSSLKTMTLASILLEKLGFEVSPKWNEKRTDIIQTIKFNTPENLVNFCKGIQKGSPIESYVTPLPAPMPGYESEEVMAGGSFITGSTIELSCDGPMRKPYTAFLQGGLTYEYGKLGILIALNELLKK